VYQSSAENAVAGEEGELHFSLFLPNPDRDDQKKVVKEYRDILDRTKKAYKNLERVLQIRIPSEAQLETRDELYNILAQAMGVRTEQVEKTLEDAKYVLTKDYLIKLLFIREQWSAKVPTILQGLTGVGKTELLRVFSLLLNCSAQLNLNTPLVLTKWKTALPQHLLPHLDGAKGNPQGRTLAEFAVPLLQEAQQREAADAPAPILAPAPVVPVQPAAAPAAPAAAPPAAPAPAAAAAPAPAPAAPVAAPAPVITTAIKDAVALAIRSLLIDAAQSHAWLEASETLLAQCRTDECSYENLMALADSLTQAKPCVFYPHLVR
jgi:hypothetical protein